MRERILLFIAPITKIIDCVTCYIGTYYTKQQKTQYIHILHAVFPFDNTYYQIYPNLFAQRIFVGK